MKRDFTNHKYLVNYQTRTALRGLCRDSL